MIGRRYGFLCILDIRKMHVMMHMCKKFRAVTFYYLLAATLAFFNGYFVVNFCLVVCLCLSFPSSRNANYNLINFKPAKPQKYRLSQLATPLALNPPTKCNFPPIFLSLPAQLWNTLQYGAYDALYNQS